MRKLILIIAGVVVVAVVGVFFALNHFLNSETIIGAASEYLSVHHQRTLTVKGEVKTSLFPKIGVAIPSVQISYPNATATQFSVDEVSVSVGFMELLSGKIRVEDVVVTGLDATIRDEDLPSTPEGAQKAASTEAPQLPDLRVKSIAITKSSVRLLDKAKKVKAEVSDLNIVTGSVSKTGSTPLTVSATFKDGSGLVANGKLTGTLDYDLAKGHIAVNGAKLDVKEAKDEWTLTGSVPEIIYDNGAIASRDLKLAATAAPSVKADVALKALSLKNNLWSANNLSVSGTYENSLVLTLAGSLSGRADTPTLTPTTLKGTLRNTATGSKVFPVSLRTSFDGKVVKVSNLNIGFTQGTNSANATYNVSGAMNAKANLASVSIQEVSSLFTKQTLVDGPVTGTVNLASADASDAQKLTGNFDAKIIKGTLSGISVSRIRKALTLKSFDGLSFDKNDKTTFNEIKAKGTLKRMVLDVNPIIANDNNIATTGRAVVDINKQTVDAKLDNKVIVDSKAKTSLSVPVAIKGKLEDPSVTIDMATLLASYVKLTVKTGAATPGNILNNAKDSIKSLKGLFK
ncbi:MAG TPA: hypothetical protein DCW60_02380 [Sutterella sp.]|nr:hypothetical protein [Sutterella sp.]